MNLFNKDYEWVIPQHLEIHFKVVSEWKQVVICT